MIVLLDTKDGQHYNTRFPGVGLTLGKIMENFAAHGSIKIVKGDREIIVPLDTVTRIGISTHADDLLEVNRG